MAPGDLFGPKQMAPGDLFWGQSQMAPGGLFGAEADGHWSPCGAEADGPRRQFGGQGKEPQEAFLGPKQTAPIWLFGAKVSGSRRPFGGKSKWPWEAFLGPSQMAPGGLPCCELALVTNTHREGKCGQRSVVGMWRGALAMLREDVNGTLVLGKLIRLRKVVWLC